MPHAAVSQRRAAACASGATTIAFERMQVIFSRLVELLRDRPVSDTDSCSKR
ncbi:MAG: hypothetical protein OXG04_20230 [Acidobacteria bacterium]|nr:hypothetical protein [Acidobacteriota bacterium]